MIRGQSIFLLCCSRYRQSVDAAIGSFFYFGG